MGKTLRLQDHLLSRARHLMEMGQPDAAIATLRRLVRLPNLPAAVAAEAHQRLGEVHLNLGQYRQARQQLRRSLRLEPASAAANHALARAIASDPHMDAAAASRYYRRALELSPREPRLLADAGAYFAQMGRIKKGLTMLRQAVDLAPESIDALRSLTETLCELERFDEALKTVRVAAFRMRSEPRLAQMREQIEFRQARHAQRKAVRPPAAEGKPPVLLPFLRVVAERPNRGTRYRSDTISKIRPHLPRIMPRMDSGRSG